jgi:prepilin-type N-terminal cleavage/methylation domain-containing protein/prepilin-type processing-associated H-X9-DG protein
VNSEFSKARAFSLIELIVAVSVIAVLAVTVTGAGWTVYKNSSLAISANNIRQLAAGGAAYLADNNYTFWKYRTTDSNQPGAVIWWFGLEPEPRPEGQRILRPDGGPLGAYVPAGLRPDPSFRLAGKPYKPKFQSGYIGIGYNVLLGGGWLNEKKSLRYWDLPRPGEIVVFATSAQVNTLQAPATAKNPMIEEFYGFDEGGAPWNNPATIHFRHRGSAMVGFADGSSGFLPLEPSTLDTRAPQAAIGRFAPKGSTKYLLPSTNE